MFCAFENAMGPGGGGGGGRAGLSVIFRVHFSLDAEKTAMMYCTCHRRLSLTQDSKTAFCQPYLGAKEQLYWILNMVSSRNY
jgi:hypothetical protein